MYCQYTVEPLYNGHPWGIILWSLYGGGLNREVHSLHAQNSNLTQDMYKVDVPTMSHTSTFCSIFKQNCFDTKKMNLRELEQVIYKKIKEKINNFHLTPIYKP